MSRFLLPFVLLSAFLCSCGPNLHAPVMSGGMEYDGIMIAEHVPGKNAELCTTGDYAKCTTPVYKVGNQHYVAGKVVTLRKNELWYWYAAEVLVRCNYTRTSDNEAIKYYPVKLIKSGYDGSTCCRFEENLTPALTELPKQNSEPVGFYTFSADYDNRYCVYNGHAHGVRVSEDGHLTPHALYAYPLGALLFLGIDVPCGIITATCGFVYGCIDEMILDRFD